MIDRLVGRESEKKTVGCCNKGERERERERERDTTYLHV